MAIHILGVVIDPVAMSTAGINLAMNRFRQEGTSEALSNLERAIAAARSALVQRPSSASAPRLQEFLAQAEALITGEGPVELGPLVQEVRQPNYLLWGGLLAGASALAIGTAVIIKKRQMAKEKKA